jgi:hypothetical protein
VAHARSSTITAIRNVGALTAASLSICVGSLKKDLRATMSLVIRPGYLRSIWEAINCNSAPACLMETPGLRRPTILSQWKMKPPNNLCLTA